MKAAPGIIVLDAKAVYDALHNSSLTALGLTEKRSGIELRGLEEHDTDLRWCHSDIQLADGFEGNWSWTRRIHRQRNERRWE